MIKVIVLVIVTFFTCMSAQAGVLVCIENESKKSMTVCAVGYNQCAYVAPKNQVIQDQIGCINMGEATLRVSEGWANRGEPIIHAGCKVTIGQKDYLECNNEIVSADKGDVGHKYGTYTFQGNKYKVEYIVHYEGTIFTGLKLVQVFIYDN